MGLFDGIIGNSEEKQMMEAKKEEKNFIRENQLIDSVTRGEETDLNQQEGRSDLLKWQQSLDDEIERLKHRLRSEVLDEQDNWMPKYISAGRDEDGNPMFERIPPLANELFIDYIESQVEPFLSRNMLNSNFNERRILEILKNTCNDIADAMADGWDIYEINFINYDLVVRLIKNVIIPGPFRALNDGQRRHDRTVAKRIEAFNDKEISKKGKGVMGVRFD